MHEETQPLAPPHAALEPRPRADLALVRGALAGEAAARDALVLRLRCVHQILSLHNHRAGRPLPAGQLEDVVQDCLLIVWRQLAGFRGDAALETWVYRCCVQEFMNATRRERRARARTAPADEGLAADAALVGDSSSWIDSELVYRGLEQLAPDEARVLRLKHFDGLTFQDMAARLGRSANTLKAIYYRGLRVLHAWVRTQEEGR